MLPKFNRWTVLRETAPRIRANGDRLTQWECRCDCGTVRALDPCSVKIGNSKSCGCWNREVAHRRFLSHGQSKTSIYSVWASMRNRCQNASVREFKNYGARGIKVCDRWQKFENFLADMGQRPTPKHTIERKDTNGNYEPTNCVWATQKEQQRNRRNNRLITVGSATKTLAEWAESSEVCSDQIVWRLKQGWTPERAVFAPNQQGKVAA